MKCIIAANFGFGVKKAINTVHFSTLSDVESEVDVRTGKQTGNSFLNEETLGRAQKGNAIEKNKLKKDTTSAYVDVYEYARKIRVDVFVDTKRPYLALQPFICPTI